MPIPNTASVRSRECASARAGMLVKKADTGFFRYVAEFTADCIDFDAVYLGVVPQPYSETDYRPATFSAPEGQIYECGAQDQGNELSVLLNEVGAQSFIDEKGKEKADSGPVGTA